MAVFSEACSHPAELLRTPPTVWPLLTTGRAKLPSQASVRHLHVIPSVPYVDPAALIRSGPGKGGGSRSEVTTRAGHEGARTTQAEQLSLSIDDG